MMFFDFKLTIDRGIAKLQPSKFRLVMRLILILASISLLSAAVVDFSVRITYMATDKRDIMFKIGNFTTNLEKQLDSYNWKLPHDDFEKIETSVNINIDKNVSGKSFTGVITVSSGMSVEARYEIPLKKDIYFSEQDLAFTLDYEADPKIDSMDPMSVETLILFYSNLALGENFDRLSYTDGKNFKLEGDFYFQKMYEFENILVSAAERKDWNKRLEIINGYRMNKNTDLRRLNAFLYNAVYFMNTGKKQRAVNFIEPISELISKIGELPASFFVNNFYALGEIFAMSTEEKHLDLLIEKDPSRENFYSGKKKEKKSPDREPRKP
jgi:hypothetical protein